MESQLNELNSRFDEAQRNFNDQLSSKGRNNQEVMELQNQLEEAESQLNQLNKIKHQLGNQLEETRRNLEDESRVCLKKHPRKSNFNFFKFLIIFYFAI